MTPSDMPRNPYSPCARLLCLYCYTALILAMIITSLPAFLPEGASVPLILSIKLIPLLLVLPGLKQKSLRAFIWLCFIDLFYFTQAVVEAFLSRGDILDLCIIALTVLMFCAALLHIKWEKAAGREL